MQIERVWSQIVRLPADEPLADGKTAPGLPATSSW